MKTRVWLKPEPVEVRGLCVQCGERPQRMGCRKNGVQTYHSRCAHCARKRDLNKKTYCERCGFQPEDPCQLDVDHINCDRSDNSPQNLQTLCSNCHRLKTKRDYLGGMIDNAPKGLLTRAVAGPSLEPGGDPDPLQR